MANRQIFQLTAKTIAGSDLLAVQDSAGSAEAKKVTAQSIADLAPADSSKLSVSAFNTYSGATETEINGKLDSVVGGTNVTIDNTDPNNPIINASGGSGGGTWGSITGTLSSQTDLQSALDDKSDKLLSVKNIATTGYTLIEADNGYLISFSNTGTTTLNLPVASALTTGFQCIVTLASATTGTLVLDAGAGNLFSEDGNTTLTKQFRGASIINTSSANYLVFGLDS